MSRERFVELVEEAVLSLPQDMKIVLRVLEDPEVNDDGRVAAAGALLHVLSGSNAIPGMRGILGLVDDALVLRLVVEGIEKSNPEAMAKHRKDWPELFGVIDEQLASTRAYLGDLISVLEGAASQVDKLTHQGHTARECGTDPEGSSWLYDAVQEAIVEQLELDEDEVHREAKKVDRILPGLRTRVGAKP